MFNTDNFLQSLVDTNKSHTFFTDWDKARANQDVYRDELALLSVMTGCDDPSEELTRLLRSYPQINSLIPLLSAIRLKSNKNLLLVLNENNADDEQYIFLADGLNDDRIKKTIRFAEKSGLLDELTKIKNHSDYYFGVEVGMDTNARKNRSGSAMESLVEEHVKELAEKHGGQYLTQKNFKTAARMFGVTTPPRQATKKGDFMLLINGKPYNIETNYFDGNGSKQEIMNSYIPRVGDLHKSGWGFALVTDGQGWLSNRKQLEEGFERIKHIYTLKMCIDGKLSELLEK